MCYSFSTLLARLTQLKTMATIYKRNNTWYLNYSDARGQHRKSLGKISEHLANVKLKQKEYELVTGMLSGAKENILFSAYSDIYLNWFDNAYPATYDTTAYAVAIFYKVFFDKILSKITAIDIESVVREQSHLRPATLNRQLSVLQALFNKAKVDGYAAPDFKIQKVRDLESKPPKYYTKDELESIYAADTETAHYWQFVVNTGLRLSEFYNLKNCDIRDGSAYILSSAQSRTKSTKWRFVPLSAGAKKALAGFDLSEEYLFPRIRKDSYKQRFRRICERAKIPSEKWGIHCLRHSFASHLVMSGASLFEVKKLLGHSKIETTEVYAHLSDAHLSKSVSNFSI